MDFIDAYQQWADAHVFYGTAHIPGPATHADPLADRAAAWEARLVEETPNGRLLRHNALFDALTRGGKLHLLHVTHALEQISEHGILYPSGGCLVGSIYCAPLSVSGSGFRMHNLAAYVLTKEAPAFVAKVGEPGSAPTPLIFEVNLPPQAYRGLAGVDYLRLGSIHLEIYRRLEYLLSKAERHQLRETIVSRTKNSTAFLALTAAIVYQSASVRPEQFLRLLDETIPRLPILGYLYFEALAEYLMLHSTTAQTKERAERGEFNNWLYKEMLFESFPHMSGKFDLAKFRPSPSELDSLIARIDHTIDTGHARAYLTERISFLVAARLFTPGEVPEAWHHTRWEFDSLSGQFGPLLGHLIHRELRTFGRYPDFYFYFDQHKALQAWNYWNHMDIVTPFNGTIPKGEIGINPAYPELDYRIWRAEQDDTGRLHPAEQLDLTIAPRLVDIKYTLMRNNQWTEPATAAA
ncbi:hypothetical protein RKE29_18200 [Streptomyces sp. B1866]|uniref:hypothetical protein n=1 Tax=Streptomyces sp. B1866 TaxID=3075431 RepID=UPI00288CBFD1|nr:hypothetical protein [Streptomyces sp. B1866]MDT3398556.1 hypothetical protein [Streptomyces sp. B1866]